MTGLMLQMAAAGGAFVALAGGTASDTQTDPAEAGATLEFTSGGLITGTGNIAAINDAWITPLSAAGSAYQIRATLSSGDTPSGTIGSWEGLGSTRTWGLSQSGVGSKACDLLIEIRRASDSVVLDSATYTLGAVVDSGA